LACDASIVKITENAGGEPLDIGRLSRSIPPAIRRALMARDRGCKYPGCTRDRYLDGHHIQHWANGGASRLSNLLSLCRYHHRAVHKGGLVIERLDDGAWCFHDPYGEAIPLHPPQLQASELEVKIDARAAASVQKRATERQANSMCQRNGGILD
jgi:hypothetical protein